MLATTVDALSTLTGERSWSFNKHKGHSENISTLAYHVHRLLVLAKSQEKIQGPQVDAAIAFLERAVPLLASVGGARGIPHILPDTVFCSSVSESNDSPR